MIAFKLLLMSMKVYYPFISLNVSNLYLTDSLTNASSIDVSKTDTLNVVVNSSNSNEISFLTSLAFLLLGWILGLLSPLILDNIRKNKQKKEILYGILTELKETKKVLVATAMGMNMRFGNYDREFIKWLHSHADIFGKEDPEKRMLEIFEKQLNYTEEEIAELDMTAKILKGGGVTLKSVNLPFLDSKISQLSLFDISLQNQLLHLRYHINSLNEEMEQARYYYRMTFDSSLTEENFHIISSNLEVSYRNVGKFSKQLVDKIDEIINSVN